MATQDEEPPNTTLKPRGGNVLLPHGGLPEVLSLHLIKLIYETGGPSGPVGKQFIAQPILEKKHFKKGIKDPLSEDEHEVAPGLVYKYKGTFDKNGNVKYFGRALWTITRFCGSYCRFCTRGREVGMPPHLKAETSAFIARKPFLEDDDIEKVLKYIKKHKEINEIIVSGGDPLTSPKNYLTKIIEGLANLQKNNSLQIVRIGTRLPVHNPDSIQNWHYDLLSCLKNPYLMIHLNHPLELTEKTKTVLSNFRTISQATVMSQTVLLAGVNDSEETLYRLFTLMAKEGIRPYYVYQNDPVYWAKHFTVPVKKAIKLWQKLRPKLSGVAATARFVIDTPFGYGKIPIPEGNAWEVEYSSYKDFKGKKHKT